MLRGNNAIGDTMLHGTSNDGSSDAKTPVDELKENEGVYEDVGLPEAKDSTADNCIAVIKIGADKQTKEVRCEVLEEDIEDELFQSQLTPAPPPPRRNPSPYYYADLFRNNEEEEQPEKKTEGPRRSLSSSRQQQHQPPARAYRKSVSLDTGSGTASVGSFLDPFFLPSSRIDRSSSSSLLAAGDGSVSSLILPSTPCSSCSAGTTAQHAPGAATSASSAESLLAACLLEWDALLMPPHRQLRGQPSDLPSVCACTGAGQCLDEDDDEADDAVTNYERPSTQKSSSSHQRHHRHLRQYQHHYLQQPEVNAPHLPLARNSHGRADNREEAGEPQVEYDIPEEGDDYEYDYDMSGRQRHVYETAFDCKVSRSDDDLDDVDRVTNHPVLQMFGTPKVTAASVIVATTTASTRQIRATSSHDPSISVGIFTPKERRKVTLLRGKERPKAVSGRSVLLDAASSTTTLSQDLEGLEIDDDEDDADSKRPSEPSPHLPLRGYSPSPPSTAPLPVKFHGANKEVVLSMNSIRSAPNLPSTSPAHPRLKDMRLPVKSLRARESPSSSKGSIMEFKGRPRSLIQAEESVHDIKGRPRSMFLEGAGPILEFKGRPNVNANEQEEEPIVEFKGRPESKVSDSSSDLRPSLRLFAVPQETCGAPVLEFKGRPSIPARRCGGVRPKYSSTESMATSSSGGSLESIRSSTSEGNRSTTSSESRRSSSLSSHSSDSGSSDRGSGGGNPTHHMHHFYHHHHHHHHHTGTPLTGSGVGGSSGSGGRFFAHHQSNKLHILSPISDKSSQEPASETSDNNRNNNSQKASPEDTDQYNSPTNTTAKTTVTTTSTATTTTDTQQQTQTSWGDSTNGFKLKRRTPQNKNLINLTLQHHQQSSSSGEAEIQGSDSGISIESRGCTKGCGKLYSNSGFSFINQVDNLIAGDNITEPVSIAENEQPTSGMNNALADLSDLPFDMPKLRRRRLLQQDTCTSGSATSVDLHDLPFDMPKLRRRLRGGQIPITALPGQTSTESSGVSQASSSQSVRDTDRPAVPSLANRPTLTLNLEPMSSAKCRLGLSLNLGGSGFAARSGETIDVQLPLERQGWYHGAITRTEAENVLRLLKEGSYLVRNSESTRQDYSLSLKSARGFMHMRIQQCPESGKFILGQFSKPFDSIPEMIQYYTINRLPIRGAEHMCLLHPVIEQLL